MGKYAGFTSVELRKPQRSYFDMTHDRRMTIEMGQLVPFMVTECLPGDSWNMSTKMLVKFLPLVAPIFNRIKMKIEFHFVPNRILWSEWEDFITQGRQGSGIDTSPQVPYLEIYDIIGLAGGYLNNGTPADWLGIPRIPDSGGGSWNSSGRGLNLLPFAAYQRIYMDYYRNRNFIADDLVPELLSGNNLAVTGKAEWFKPRYRGWNKNDVYVSALPWTQRGDEVLIPMEGTPTYLATSLVKDNNSIYTGNLQWDTTSNLSASSIPGATTNARIENIDTIDNTSITINDFRSAMALQGWMERQAVGGSRYTETIQAHFGVKPQDSRLQRAEYIGGAVLPIQISEILTTAFSLNEVDAVVPPANQAGRGGMMNNTGSFKYYAQEHGFIMGIMTVMPEASYMQGLPRMFKRDSFLDYPWPSFARLGEQEVHNWELYMNNTSMTPDVDGNYPLFGYQSRYIDWKYIPNTTHGTFRTDLNYWTITRNFSSLPVLGDVFVTYQDGTDDDIWAAPTTFNILVFIVNSCGVKRSLPYFAQPALL